MSTKHTPNLTPNAAAFAGNDALRAEIERLFRTTRRTLLDLELNYLLLAGGTLTGALTLAADPTTALGAATKQYVDAGEQSALKLIEYKSLSSDASAIFNSGLTTYNGYKLFGWDVVPATDAVHLYLQISIASSIKSANYAWNLSLGSSSSGAFDLKSTSDVGIKVADSCGSASGESVSFEINIPNLAGTALYKNFQVDSYLVNITPEAVRNYGSGYYTAATSAIDQLRVIFNAGNIESGNMALYGVATT